jgi:hypothetical protein
VHWALLVRGSQLLASREAFDSRDEIIWLALSGGSQVVPQASIATVVVSPLVVVVVAALQEVIALLLLLVRPSLRHVVVGDAGDGGASVEEAASVGSQELVTFLFTLR